MYEGRPEDQERQPPQPPDIGRGIRLPLSQWLGLPIIALIPVLAIFGVFGERWDSVEAEHGGIRAEVEYPIRLRSKSSRPMAVRIENRTAATVDTIDVEFDAAYIEHFSGVNIIPSPREAFIVSLIGVRPGETRGVFMELHGESAGRHNGRIVLRFRGDSLTLRVTTTVFP